MTKEEAIIRIDELDKILMAQEEDSWCLEEIIKQRQYELSTIINGTDE